MPPRSFKRFVEQELGKFPHFLIYAVLEWVLIIILFVDGILAFLANEFAKFFELRIPCLLCTRIDHILLRRNPDFYYNDSICESHKKQVSHMAYCHVHKKLSDIRRMCEGCLLSFATERESDCDTYKSLVGILHKDLECFVEDDLKINLKLPAGRKDEDVQAEKISDTDHNRCSCCGDPLKVKLYYSKGAMNGSAVNKLSQFSPAPTPSPRAPFVTLKSDSSRNLELPHIRYTELKLVADNESEVTEDVDISNALLADNQGKEDLKAATVPLLTESEYLNEESRTPTFARGNRFFGIPLTDSASASPRWATKTHRKSPLEKTEFSPESVEGNHTSEAEGESILHRLKRQVRLDRKSLMALYMELDEERSASAVAANNAMAMITRLQAEKAAVQMEALQYQRMMEEQAEYDQEALQVMKDLLAKKEAEVKAFEDELEAYRERYGLIREDSGLEEFVEQADNGYEELTCHSPVSEKSEIINSPFSNIECNSHRPSHEENGVTPQNDSSPDFVGGRSPLPLLSQVQKSLSKKRIQVASDTGITSSDNSSDKVDNKKEESEDGPDKSKGSSTKQVPDHNEKLKVVEGGSRFLKETALILEKTSREEETVLTESNSLGKAGNSLTSPFDENAARPSS